MTMHLYLMSDKAVRALPHRRAMMFQSAFVVEFGGEGGAVIKKCYGSPETVASGDEASDTELFATLAEQLKVWREGKHDSPGPA